MAVKIVIGIVFCLVAIFGIQRFWSNYHEKERVRRGRVAIALEDAKSTGKKDVQLLSPMPYYASVNGLDEALLHYTTVLAEPIRSESRVSSDSRNIETWYKLRILDFLSEPEISSTCDSCFTVEQVPTELLPIHDDEIVIAKNGGSIVSDDVTVTSRDLAYPDLKLNQRYFLFLALDRYTRIASIELGPKGVLAVDNDGDVKSIDNQTSALATDLKERYGKVDKIREQLKFRRFEGR